MSGVYVAIRVSGYLSLTRRGGPLGRKGVVEMLPLKGRLSWARRGGGRGPPSTWKVDEYSKVDLFSLLSISSENDTGKTLVDVLKLEERTNIC